MLFIWNQSDLSRDPVISLKLHPAWVQPRFAKPLSDPGSDSAWVPLSPFLVSLLSLEHGRGAASTALRLSHLLPGASSPRACGLLSSFLQVGLVSPDQKGLCSGAQLYLTLCDPMDCSPPGSSVHGIFQAGILEWVAIPSLRKA